MRCEKYILPFMLLVLCALTPSALLGQDLTFDYAEWDFGEIAEDGGVVSHIFTLRNGSSSPVVIISSSANCGCTTSQYPKQPIMPGESGEVVVDYDPMNRPYTFTTTVRLLTSACSQPLALSISGDVIPRAKSMEESYPFVMGDALRLGANYTPLSYIEHGVPRASSVGYINPSKRSVELELRAKQSSGLLSINYPRVIASGESGVINFDYTVDAASRVYGAVMDSFEVYVNGKLSRYPFTVLGHITEHFDEEYRKHSAKAALAYRTIKMGTLKHSGGVAVRGNTIENVGIEPLVIRHIALDEGVESSLEQGVVVPSGESLDFEIRVTPSKFNYDMFTKYITLTTNDAEQPMQRIRINGVVEK